MRGNLAVADRLSTSEAPLLRFYERLRSLGPMLRSTGCLEDDPLSLAVAARLDDPVSRDTGLARCLLTLASSKIPTNSCGFFSRDARGPNG
jgi:hypothetical protein